MIRETCVAAALVMGFTGAVLADTPGDGAGRGSGGAGVSAGDKNLRPSAGGDSRVLRQDGAPADQADIEARQSGAKTSDLKRDAAAPTGVGATGTPAGAGKSAGSLPEEVRAAPK